MNKVLKVLSLSFLLCLSLVVAPFHISANASLSAPFVGYNVYIYDFDSMTYVQSYNVDLDMTGLQFTCSNMQSSGGCMTYKQSGSSYDNTGTISLKYGASVNNTIYRADIILDDNYVGYVNLTAFGQTKNWYVNGNTISFNWTDAQSNSQTITINSYELNKLNDGERWNFPLESFNFIRYQMYSNKEIVGINAYNEYYLPIYELKQNEPIMYVSMSPGSKQIVIVCWFKILPVDLAGIQAMIDFPDTNGEYMELGDYKVIEPIWNSSVTSENGRFVSFTVTNTSDSLQYTGRVRYKFNRTINFMPVYFNYDYHKYLSTDFALQFGLSNQLLDDLHLIANGTSSSVSSQSDLTQKTDDLNTSSNQLVTQEDAFNDDMNSALQNIDTNFNVGSNFGSKFIASADWVKTQYDRLTGNTPFGSVISFSLLIGLALLLVGKVFK